VIESKEGEGSSILESIRTCLRCEVENEEIREGSLGKRGARTVTVDDLIEVLAEARFHTLTVLGYCLKCRCEDCEHLEQ